MEPEEKQRIEQILGNRLSKSSDRGYCVTTFQNRLSPSLAYMTHQPPDEKDIKNQLQSFIPKLKSFGYVTRSKKNSP